jgi:hypothetical protein
MSCCRHSCRGKGGTFKAHGNADQQLLIPSMPPRTMYMTMDIDGKRIGECKAD